MTYEVIQGNNIHVLKTYPDNHFDSIVTDPPYGIDFLGKSWDANTGALETYQECLRVLKPGGTVLDPFNGSGSTGCAAVELGFNYVGIDLDPKYVEISLKRIEAWNKCDTTFNQLFDL